MASKNDITGDALISKATTEAYSSGWDRIFNKRTLYDEYIEMVEILEETNQQSDTPSTDDHGIQSGAEK